MTDKTTTTVSSPSVGHEPGKPASTGTTDAQPLQSVGNLLSVKRVADILDVSEDLVLAEAHAGRLAHVRAGLKLYRFTEAQVQAYVDQQTVPAVNPFARSTRSRRGAS